MKALLGSFVLLLQVQGASALVPWYTAPGSANGACASQGMVPIASLADCTRYVQSFMKANRREASHTSNTVVLQVNDAAKPAGCFIELDPSDAQTSYPFGIDASNAPISTAWSSNYNVATTTSPTQATLDGLIQICTLPTVQDAEQIACGAGTGIDGVQFKSVDGNSCLGSDNARHAAACAARTARNHEQQTRSGHGFGRCRFCGAITVQSQQASRSKRAL